MNHHNTVSIIQHDHIAQAGITAAECMTWVEESFKIKYESQLPPKISLHPQGDDFFNTMPALLPPRYGRFGVKVVHRIDGQVPSLGADILLYDSATGRLLAVVDGDWITTMRTGAVAALATRLLQRTGVHTYSMMGLGNTARATALCLLADHADEPVTLRLLRYKDQAQSFIERLSSVGTRNVQFEVVDEINDLVAGADVLISCITSAKGLICDHDELFRPGMLLLPVHTRGFQNCDLFFDKVFADDTGHVSGFKYFNRFKRYDELSRVLLEENPGRESDHERILGYNIGLGLHDVLFASKIYDRVKDCEHFVQRKETAKFWI